MKKKTGFVSFFCIMAIPVLLVALSVVIIDPFFHYHKPIEGMPIILSDERYQNDGIVKHFEYEAIITGSSETQNFKTSEFEKIFNVKAVKTSFAGAKFKEVDELVRMALQHNDNVKIVVRSLDINTLNSDKNEVGYEDTPNFLYDSNPFNDYEYLFNQDVIIDIGLIVQKMIRHEEADSFDDYSYFADEKTYGKQAVLATFARCEVKDGEVKMPTEEDYARIRENLEQNVIETAKKNPEVTFYYFIPPYSAYFWDATIRSNEFDFVLETERYAMELLTEVPNIRLYSFSTESDITCNPEKYMDTLHYDGATNTYILKSMAEGNGLITAENYEEEILRAGNCRA